MSDYLSEVEADYAYVFDIPPQNIMDEDGAKNQIIHTFDDGSISVVSKSTVSRFTIQLQFDVLEETDADTIIDLWHDTEKANGSERTFYWEHPIEGTVYTVRQLALIKRSQAHQNYLLAQISGMVLNVEGVAPSGV